MPSRLSVQRITTIALVGSLGAGCASYEAQEFQFRAASSMLNHDNYNDYGLIFAARLPESEEYREKHYGCDPIDYNLLPIEIFLENSSEDANFEVRVETARLKLAGGTVFVPVDPNVVAEDLGYSGWSSLPWWPFLIFPGFMALSDVWQANEDLEKHVESRAIVDRNIAPRSRPVHGVIFFRPEDPDLDIDDIEMREMSASIEVTMRSPTSAGDRYFTQVHFSGIWDPWAE